VTAGFGDVGLTKRQPPEDLKHWRQSQAGSEHSRKGTSVAESYFAETTPQLCTFIGQTLLGSMLHT